MNRTEGERLGQTDIRMGSDGQKSREGDGVNERHKRDAVNGREGERWSELEKG